MSEQANDERQDDSVWPPSPIEGDPVPLPGFEDIEVRPEEGRRSWTG